MTATLTHIHIKHPQTGKCQTITMQKVTHTGWGFRFFVDSELEAYQAAYKYRSNPHGVKVEFARGAGQWMVTVFNSEAAPGIDRT